MQGLTLDEIVVDMEGGKRFNPGQAYVAFSRVKTLNGLHLLNFEPSAIKASSKVCDEMRILSSKVVQNVPVPQCHRLCDSHVTIALLNIRCLLNKLPDITNDENMNCADVVCLCETWLSPTQQIPQLFDGHVNLRCDRSHANNNKRGVLISVDHKLKPLGIYQLSNNSVECHPVQTPCSSNISIIIEELR